MTKLLEAELSYRIRGALINVSRKYGYVYKESHYQKACQEEFESQNIVYLSQPKIEILSLDTGKRLSIYIPDFLIDNKIIVELKAQEYIPKRTVDQLNQYLRASKYEIGYLVNFGEPRVRIIRRIYTNDRKSWLKMRGKLL